MNTEVADDIVILRPEGRLTIETHGAIGATVRRHVDAGRAKLVINLARVPYTDSIGVAELVRAHTIAYRAGGRLLLADVPDTVRTLLSMTRLNTVVGIAPAETDAMHILSEARTARLRGSGAGLTGSPQATAAGFGAAGPDKERS